MSLKRLHTLRNKQDFNYVFQDALKVYGKHTTLLFRPSPKPQPRLGLIVSKKHTKTAVKRNMVRRVIKESFRAKLNGLSSIDVVVLSKAGIVDVDKKTLRQLLDKQWQILIKNAPHNNLFD